MATTQTTCSSCHCEGRGWIPGDELMPGKGDPFDVFPCYCRCHAKARVRPGEGIWVCGDCSFTANDFEDLQHHVYEVHPGIAF